MFVLEQSVQKKYEVKLRGAFQRPMTGVFLDMNASMICATSENAAKSESSVQTKCIISFVDREAQIRMEIETKRTMSTTHAITHKCPPKIITLYLIHAERKALVDVFSVEKRLPNANGA